MTMKRLWLALVLTSMTSISVCDGILVAKKYCSYFYHFSKTTKDCILCTNHCQAGQGLERNCGYDDYGNKIKEACTPCKDGYFSPTKKHYFFNIPSLPCRRCRQCFPPSRTKRKCSPYRNAKCSKCPRGMYKHSDGHCYKCSYCCDGMLESGVNVVASCKRKTKGRCACRAFTNCRDNVDHNSKCPAYDKKSSTMSILKKRN